MLIGGHVSVAGGIEKAPERGAAIGANTIQIFASPPRSFKRNNYSQEQLAAFRAEASQHSIEAMYLHGVYMINLAHPDKDYRRVSIDSLLSYMEISQAIGAKGIIFHPGFLQGLEESTALQNVIDCCRTVLANTPSDQWLLIENSAGARGSIGSSFTTLATMLEGINHDQLGFCIDTQHVFAAGWDMRTPENITVMLEQFDHYLGMDRLQAFHCNDSKTECGSHLDRHENIGQGKIGIAGFQALINNPILQTIPFILEVPGIEDKGPDKANIDLLRSHIQT